VIRKSNEHKCNIFDEIAIPARYLATLEEKEHSSSKEEKSCYSNQN